MSSGLQTVADHQDCAYPWGVSDCDCCNYISILEDYKLTDPSLSLAVDRLTLQTRTIHLSRKAADWKVHQCVCACMQCIRIVNRPVYADCNYQHLTSIGDQNIGGGLNLYLPWTLQFTLRIYHTQTQHMHLLCECWTLYGYFTD